MDFRLIGKDTLPLAADLWSYSFEKKGDPFFEWYFNDYCLKENTVIGGFDGYALACMLHLNPYSIMLRGKQVKVPYIVGVATAPEYRGQHLFAPLLETAFTLLRAQGAVFALLMPISAKIYKPYGFDYCYYRHAYKMPLSALKTVSGVGQGITLKRYKCDDVVLPEILSAIYDKEANRYNGFALRFDAKWLRLLNDWRNDGMHVVVVYKDKVPCAYMAYGISNKNFNAHELIADSYDSEAMLLRYAAQHRSEAETFTWLAEAENKAYLYFDNAEYSGSVRPFMMARCINVRKALEMLPIDKNIEGEFTLLLTDDFIPLNNSLLEVSVAGGVLTAKSTLDEEDIVMDTAAFTQLYFGAFSAKELLEAGRIKARSYEKVKILQGLFPKCRNYINEFY